MIAFYKVYLEDDMRYLDALNRQRTRRCRCT
jgi:hypothetical protein